MNHPEPAFVVPPMGGLLTQMAGKRPGTVLTVQVQLYNVKVCEYQEEFWYDRSWCYETAVDAFVALATYLSSPEAEELTGWIRAVSIDEGIRYPQVETPE